MLKKLCLVMMIASIASGCSVTHKLAASQYTDFEKVDQLKSAMLAPAGVPVGVDSVKTRQTHADEDALGNYLWTRRTTVNFNDETNPNRTVKPAKYLTNTINIRLKDPEGFFTAILKKRGLAANSAAQKRLNHEVKKIALLSSQIGKEKFHACELTLGIRSGGKELESIGTVKIPASEMNFIRGDSFTSAKYQSDKHELETVELAFVDALQKGLLQLVD